MARQISDMETIRILINHLSGAFVTDVVISPGAHSLPLTVSLLRTSIFQHHMVLDERSAGFIALGMSQMTITPVVLVCSRETGLLNYGPALAEAYYQHSPIIVISTDRSHAYINHDNGHTIRQDGMFSQFFRYECQLPSKITCDEDRWHTNRILKEAMNTVSQESCGPVHINIPIREPLYGFNSSSLLRISGTLPVSTVSSISDFSMQNLCRYFNEKKKIMIIVGSMLRSLDLGEQIRKMEKNYEAVIVFEHFSNLVYENGIRHIDRVLSTITPEEENAYSPDLVIVCGGSIHSRKLIEFINNGKMTKIWYIGMDKTYAPDTFKSLAVHVPLSPDVFFEHFIKTQGKKRKRSKFHQLWENKAQLASQRHKSFLEALPWSDLKVFSIIAQYLPEESDLQLGNSTPVRYMDLFDYSIIGYTWGNCGTGSIEGCLSTAAGFAIKTETTVTAIIGDNSFLHDSNALLFAELPTNLRIIVIDNEGGNIYRILPETTQLEEARELCELPHEQNIARIAEAYSMKVLTAHDEDSMREALKDFYSPQELPTLLVVKTPAHMNGEILRQYFQYLSHH